MSSNAAVLPGAPRRVAQFRSCSYPAGDPPDRPYQTIQPNWIHYARAALYQRRLNFCKCRRIARGDAASRPISILFVPSGRSAGSPLPVYFNQIGFTTRARLLYQSRLNVFKCRRIARGATRRVAQFRSCSYPAGRSAGSPLPDHFNRKGNAAAPLANPVLTALEATPILPLEKMPGTKHERESPASSLQLPRASDAGHLAFNAISLNLPPRSSAGVFSLQEGASMLAVIDYGAGTICASVLHALRHLGARAMQVLQDPQPLPAGGQNHTAGRGRLWRLHGADAGAGPGMKP